MGQTLIQKGITDIFGHSVQITEKYPLSGGCINKCWNIHLSNGEKLFAKENSSRYNALFKEEARGLLALSAAAGPKVPEVIWVGEDNSTQILLLEYIEPTRKKPGFFIRFGHELAELHRKAVNEQFGFEYDNHIGASAQINTWTDSWLEFFRNTRLLPQIETAARQGNMDDSLQYGFENLNAKLESLLSEPEHPSLIHGDLWSGNFMCFNDNKPVLIDPAVSYSHREADIAMTRLFGGFPEKFYAAYNEAFPLDQGYNEREDLYNLYHMLNHLNLFGRSYLSSVKNTLRKYGCL